MGRRRVVNLSSLGHSFASLLAGDVNNLPQQDVDLPFCNIGHGDAPDRCPGRVLRIPRREGVGTNTRRQFPSITGIQLYDGWDLWSRGSPEFFSSAPGRR